jgi:hypothetical protein
MKLIDCFMNCFCSSLQLSYYISCSNNSIYCKKLDINRHLECCTQLQVLLWKLFRVLKLGTTYPKHMWRWTRRYEHGQLCKNLLNGIMRTGECGTITWLWALILANSMRYVIFRIYLILTIILLRYDAMLIGKYLPMFWRLDASIFTV